jgi:hypothetical protein
MLSTDMLQDLGLEVDDANEDLVAARREIDDAQKTAELEAPTISPLVLKGVLSPAFKVRFPVSPDISSCC